MSARYTLFLSITLAGIAFCAAKSAYTVHDLLITTADMPIVVTSGDQAVVTTVGNCHLGCSPGAKTGAPSRP